jgi:type II secretory pathway pseudopilin PulG
MRLRAMTLIELILVMLIICAVLGMAAPSLRHFFGSRRTADAAAQIVALARYARSQAVAEGRSYRLAVDRQGGTYRLLRRAAGRFVALDTEFGRTFALPAGTRVDWLVPPPDGPRDYVEFRPSGRGEPAVLRLTGRNDEVYDIASGSPSERFRVVRPREIER